MIVNKRPYENKIEDIIQKFNDSPFRFFITGSRSVGIHDNEKSDYDFFVSHSLMVERFLEELGFVRLDNEPYYPKNDTLQELVCIYRHSDLPIDVQLVENADKKWQIQMAIAPLLVGARNAGKDIARLIWQTAYLAFNRGNNCEKF